MPDIAELAQRLEAAVKRGGELAERIRPDVSTDDIKGIRAEYEAQKTQIAELVEQKQKADQVEEMKAMRADLDALLGTVHTSRKHQFEVGGHGQPAQPSLVSLLYRARKHMDMSAMEQLNAWNLNATKAYELEGKAIGGGTSAGGGYLVVPQFLQDLVALRRASAPMRDFLTVIPGVKSNLVYVPQQTGVELVAWTAENAVKTSTDETFGQIATNIFTLAGIAKVSNHLLEDSSPAVDAIVKTSLGRGLAIEEDRAFINGSGTGQPTGILNTSGITATAVSAGTAAAIFDDILSAIGRVQASYFGQPDAILMAPRTWTKLLSAKDANLRYLSTSSLIGAQMTTLPGVSNPTGAGTGGTTTFMGIPVVIDANMPINQSGALSSIIVGAFKEAWVLERDGIRMDMSSEAGTSFEQNQTWFRGEERVGFTAARLPVAFHIVTGETA